MERVESSFLLIAAVSTLEIHRLYISMEQKQRATRRRRLRQASAARRSTMLCARHWPLFSCKRKEGGASFKFFESLCCGGCVTHCLNCFDFSSQFGVHYPAMTVVSEFKTIIVHGWSTMVRPCLFSGTNSQLLMLFHTMV